MSEKQDFSEIGERIRSAIQDAVETGDFGQINAVVNDTVGGAMEEVRRQVNQVHERINRPYGDRNTGEQNAASKEDGTKGTDYASRYRNRHISGQRRTMYASDRAARRVQEAEEYKENLRAGNQGPQAEDAGRMTVYQGRGTAVLAQDRQTALPVRYFRKNGKVAGVLFTVFGGIGIGIGSLLTFLFLITWLMFPEEEGMIAMTTLFALMTGGFGIMLKRGCGLQARLKRAERYLRMAKEKMYLELEDLAVRTGQSLRKVRRDVRKMLRAGIFPEGHLDAKERVLMLSDESWQQYGDAKAGYEDHMQVEEETQEEEQPEEKGADLTAEQQIEQEGRAYMERLRQLNIEIPGEVISNKLYQLDYLLQRIFMVLKEHPEKCPQMRKFMDYYLPTTVKLVESYADFDKAGVQGENIKTAKAEIEKTMDTINQAFEKLLDDMYQDAAFEAAADAKVLKTVLAQDGYMKSEFSTNAKKEGEE